MSTQDKRQSDFLPEVDLIQFDPTTGETTNRGNPVDAPSRSHQVRQQRQDEWDEYCYRQNVVLYGRDKADALRRFALEGDV